MSLLSLKIEIHLPTIRSALVESQEILQNPLATDQARAAANKTQSYMSSIYSQVMQKSLAAFIENLNRSSSHIDHKYAQVLQQKDIFEQTSIDILQLVCTSLENAISNQIKIAQTASPDTDLLAAEYTQDITAAFDLYKQLGIRIGEKIPEQHSLFPDFLRVHIETQRQVTQFQEEIKNIFARTVAKQVDCTPEDKEIYYATQIHEIKEKIRLIFMRTIKEIVIIKQAQETTETPIAQHIECIQQLSSYLTSKKTSDLDAFIEKLLLLQKEDPELANYYSEIIFLLKKHPINTQKILEKLVQLKEKLHIKMHQLISAFNALSENSEKLLFQTISEKLTSQKKCQNPSCPSTTQLLVSLKKCSRCRTAFYCSPECQRQDWPNHKVRCKKFVP